MMYVGTSTVAAPTPVEEVPAGETKAIGQMIETLTRQLTERYIDKNEVVRRDAHPRTLGVVKAKFIVADDVHLPVELRHGIFSKPGKTYDAAVRFSNGNPTLQHDLAPDVRGAAIKLIGAREDALPEHGQDFLLATAEAFFGKNAVDFASFPDASEKAWKVGWYFIGGLRVRGVRQFLSALRTPSSPLALEYFSQTPYRLGPHCVKYHVRPPHDFRSTSGDRHWYMRSGIRQIIGLLARLNRAPKNVPRDAVRQALIGDLECRSVTLDFLVQRWPDLGQLPTWAIENATRMWPARWQKVAAIEIFQTDAKIPGDDDRHAERMTFSPAHSLLEHQPLGSINRARMAIYRTMSDFRNSHNRGDSVPGPQPALSSLADARSIHRDHVAQ